MTAAPGAGRSAWKFLIGLGAVLTGLAGFFVITTRSVLSPERFGANVAASLADDRVAVYVSNQLTDAIIAARPNLLAVRPILLTSVQSIVRSAPFRAVVATSARTTHRFFFEEAGERVVLSLPDIGAVVRSALAQASPDLAAKIPPDVEAQLASGDAERAISRFISLWKAGDKLRLLSWIGFYSGLVMIVGGIALARDRQRALADAGLALVIVGVAYVAVVPAARLVIYSAFADNEMAGFVHGMVKAFLGRLRAGALLVGLPGLVLVAAGTATLDRFRPSAVLQGLAGLLTTPPERQGRRALWVISMLALGTAAFLWPMTVLRATLMLFGLGLTWGGLRELFLMIRGHSAVLAPSGVAVGARGWLGVALPAVVLLGVGGIGAWLVSRGGPEPVGAARPVTCNGSAELCFKTVDEVVFAGAHNAMSNGTVEGWMFPHHAGNIVAMLEAGVRMLAIDIHYGIPTGGRIKTDIEHEVSSRDKIAEALGAEGVAAAMRIRDRLVGGDEGPQGLYFCHGFCELGAYDPLPVLEGIKDWLAANPGEVVLMVIEDYVTPHEIDSLFKASGLFDYVYTGSTTTWSTLGEMVDANQRLVVFIESGHTGVAYLRSTAGVIQETPYTFHTPREFSCRPNRGGTTGSLFMINNWIETTPAPRPTNAEIVNAYENLLRRARLCQRQRRRLPNVLLVDFYDVGDLMRVVNTLNGIDTSSVSFADGRR